MGRNHRTRTIVCFLLILTVLSTTSLFADLGDFGDAVKEDQEEEPAEEEEDSDDTDDDELSESEAELMALLFDITIGLWMTHNLSAWYTPYPYSVDSFSTSYVGHNYNLLDYFDAARPDLKQNRMSFYLSGGAFPIDAEYGYTASFRMTSKILAAFGTDLEYRWWGDESGNLHFLRTGGLLPIVQTDFFSLDMAMAGAFFFDLFTFSGFTFGAVVTTYPFRPLSLELRGGGIFSSTVNLGEIGLKVGIHLNRFEFFLGYYGLLHTDLAIHAFDAGIGMHF